MTQRRPCSPCSNGIFASQHNHKMLSEDFFAAVCGPPLTSNTAIAKDVAIYHQTLSPAQAVRATFKKSATPIGGLALSPSHVFAAQQERSYVHVYSRLRGGQEAAVPMPEKVRCLALAGDVLVAGTAEGRLILWEVRLAGRWALSFLFSPFTNE